MEFNKIFTEVNVSRYSDGKFVIRAWKPEDPDEAIVITINEDEFKRRRVLDSPSGYEHGELLIFS